MVRIAGAGGAIRSLLYAFLVEHSTAMRQSDRTAARPYLKAMGIGGMWHDYAKSMLRDLRDKWEIGK